MGSDSYKVSLVVLTEAKTGLSPLPLLLVLLFLPPLLPLLIGVR